MSLPDLDELTASRAVEDLRQGKYSAESLVEACFARIERHNPRLNALVTVNREAATALARRVDTQLGSGDLAGDLLGIPISVKDSFATADMVTTASFRPLANYRPDRDASVVGRLRAAGAILLGKSNLPELAGAPHCWSPLFGLCRNPWDPSLTPGGSSGGAAAAVASGFSLMEIGSDIGGSIRIPAAYCGIAGLRATENRIPRTGHIPHLPAEFGGSGRSVWHMLSFGILARSVADLHLGYRLIAGPDGEDSTVPPFEAPGPLPLTQERPGGALRIALWEDFDGTPVCPRTRSALDKMAEKLNAAGHRVTRTAPPDFDVRAAWQVFGMIAGPEVGLGMPAWQRHLLRRLRFFLPRDQLIARAVAAGFDFDMRRYNQALNCREALIRSLESFLDQWDVVLCPVAPSVPYPGQPMPLHKPPPRIAVGARTLPYFEATVPMAIPFSVTGSPVVVLPIGVEDGLPVGVQVIGKRWQEESLLGMSARLEKVLGGFVPPPLSTGH